MTEDEKRQKKISLTVSLLRPSISTPTQIFKSPKALGSLAIGHGPGSVGTLFYRPSESRKPIWLELFEPLLRSVPKGLRNSTTAAALILKRHGRTFAVTFGTGRHLLHLGVAEDNFGLKVTLNSIEPDKIRSIDRQTFDAIATHTRSQSSREAAADQFGLDVERDLVRAVTGTPREESLGIRMAGADSLTIRVAADIADLPALLERYLERFESDDYKEHFSWLDRIQPVKERRVQEQLNEQLLTALQADDFGNAFLAVPEVIDWAQVSGFKYTEQGELEDDIHLRGFMASLRDSSSVSLTDLHRRSIRCIGKDLDQVAHKWPVFKCLNAEVDFGGERYLLASGRWYRIATSFVEEINAEVSGIPRSSVVLPDYSDSDEAAYNQRVATDSAGAYALMDCESIIHGGGSSRIEFCDLYGRDRKMLHVKRYGGSQPLSHLFSQGLVSSRLFLSDRDFRRKVNEKLPASHRLRSTDVAPRPEEFEVVFGIISRSARPIPDSLPFFSKITLVTVCRQLNLFRLKTSVLKIGATA